MPLPLPSIHPVVPASGQPSFERVYRDHAAQVARWVWKLRGPGVDVDDAVQKVFVVVDRKLGAFRGDAALATWLYQITARVVANDRRAARRSRLWSRLTRQMEDRIPSSSAAPGDALEERQAMARFYRILDALPERYREVLVLFELEEMPTERIAELVGRPPATVRVWLHRARAAFTTKWAATDADADANANINNRKEEA